VDNNVKFKIKSYIEILKYTEDKQKREWILQIINEYLENYDEIGITNNSSNKLKKAKDIILSNMSNGKCKADDIVNLLESKGFSKGTINRAKQELSIKSIREGGIADNGIWYWISIDPYKDRIEEWLNEQTIPYTSAYDIWCNCLNMNRHAYTHKEAFRINQIIDQLPNWHKVSTVKITRKTEGGHTYFKYQGKGYKNKVPHSGDSI